jgi:hypothetical protein
MRSPFPGMDPYLETRWGDVHVRLCGLLSAALQPHLPRGLRARSEEEVILEDEAGDALQTFRPDAMVVQTWSKPARDSSGAAAAIVEQIDIDFSLLEPTDRWVQIIDTTAGNRVITAIEILSPSNKATGKANERYRKKINNFMNAGVNVVEIDLLRSGRDRLIVKADSFPPDRQTPYAVCIWRVTNPFKISLVPIPLRSPLPTIPIPCRETDPEISLALQPLIDQIYIDGGHDDIDYAKPLREPLTPDDVKWASELLAASR